MLEGARSPIVRRSLGSLVEWPQQQVHPEAGRLREGQEPLLAFLAEPERRAILAEPVGQGLTDRAPHLGGLRPAQGGPMGAKALPELEPELAEQAARQPAGRDRMAAAAAADMVGLGQRPQEETGHSM